ncbi:MAG TPA: PIG-L family deacetylase [Longimicrobiales bacterium]|nr:PIG-L family deacetylase [Longimicrobiales bacterium]
MSSLIQLGRLIAALAWATSAVAQQPARTLVAVLAHADDEGAVAPLLARYSPEGAKVFLIVVTDGAQSGRSSSTGPDLARVRAGEAQCAAAALGAQSPILLGYPDGKLGDYVGDRSLIYRLTARLAGELDRLRTDVVITWGPDGGTGHPDHRLVSNVVTQLARAGARGVPERVYYMSFPAESIRAMNPQRGEPPLLVPAEKHLTVRVPFTPADLEAARGSLRCHRSQFDEDTAERLFRATARAWNGTIALAPGFSGAPATELLSWSVWTTPTSGPALYQQPAN